MFSSIKKGSVLMKVLVTGSKGQLGADVVKELCRRGHGVCQADLPECDILDIDALATLFDEEKPDAVAHLAAYTAVDKAESEPELCFAVNAEGTRNVAAECAKRGIKMLYTSTDYVFGGDGDKFYETDDEKAPLNVYGKSKLEGEYAVSENCKKSFIVRISWVFGRHGKNFAATILRLAKEKDEIRVVNDQTGSPTFTEDLAPLLCDMLESEKYGVYHATNEGVCTFAEWAQEAVRLKGLGAEIIPIPTSEYPTPAARPQNSRLSKASLDENGFGRLPDWRDAVKRFVEETEE